MEKQEEDVLTNESNDALERIKSLVKETNKMKKEVPKRRETIQQNFKSIRDKITSSTHYLTKIKQDIENIKLTLEEDRRKTHDLTDHEFIEMCTKTDEEIDAEFQKVHSKLDDLQKRVTKSKDKLMNDNRTFEETLFDTVTTLDNVGKGVYKIEEIDE